jgi:pimeloyl-ACP methyl ester carboxylesterase
VNLLSYREVGSGEPVVLLHGWGISFPVWREVIPLLAQDFRLIIPELPGIGESPLQAEGRYYDLAAESLEQLREHLGLETWRLVGYSLGGWAARTYSRRWPQRVTSLTYVCAARPLPPAAVALALLLGLDRASARFGNWLLSRWRLKGLISLMGFNGRPHELSQLWFTEIVRQGLPALKRSLSDMPSLGLANLQVPGVPIRYLWGKADTIGVAPLFPGKMDRVLAGTHALPMTNAPELAGALLPLLKEPREPN